MKSLSSLDAMYVEYRNPAGTRYLKHSFKVSNRCILDIL